MLHVITNNGDVSQMMAERQISCQYQAQGAAYVLADSRDRLLEGWRLAADPLAGYNTRFNPYHTVFLMKTCPLSGQELAAEVLRLERARLHLSSPKRLAAEEREDIVQDYQCLDTSLAENTLAELQKYFPQRL